LGGFFICAGLPDCFREASSKLKNIICYHKSSTLTNVQNNITKNPLAEDAEGAEDQVIANHDKRMNEEFKHE
jgi:hypothetical protein